MYTSIDYQYNLDIRISFEQTNNKFPYTISSRINQVIIFPSLRQAYREVFYRETFPLICSFTSHLSTTRTFDVQPDLDQYNF